MCVLEEEEGEEVTCHFRQASQGLLMENGVCTKPEGQKVPMGLEERAAFS